MVEEVVSNWISEVALAYGCDTVRFGGGVAMNVKLNMMLNQSSRLEDLYICPSPTDNTLSIGACYASSLSNGLSCDQLHSVNDVYLGPRFDTLDVDTEIRKNNINGKYVVESDVTSERIAQWLAEGKVVARFAGAMEFGERALGNRSILADPRDAGTIAKINQQIKYRDFWMPFAPVILEESAPEYIVESENLEVFNHMMIGSNSTSLGREVLIAGIHPADKSMRPQVIKKSQNQDYWEIVNSFKQITGVGALINTSFNLHGEPIVGSPSDAISTFERSDLDVVVMENRALLRV
jgi:carbamoyltransferase